MPASRSLLPPGYSAFRPRLGMELGQKRRGESLKQQTVADDIGISRACLSRIECGHAWPAPDTLDALLSLYGLDWGDVAIAGTLPGATRRMFDGTDRCDSLMHLGRKIRSGRRAKGLKLRPAAAKAGISASQLSRIERGQCVTSGVFTEPSEDMRKEKARRSVILTNEFLIELAAAGSA